MTLLLQTIAGYVPNLVLGRRQGYSPPLPARESLPAALLFADISGFTSLTERLVQAGPAGVEELTQLLNLSFGQILDHIEAEGGDVVTFAGDALLAIWATEANNLADAAHRAAQCALGIQQRIRNLYRLIDSAPLTLRIGVSAGKLALIEAGGADGRRELLLTGVPVGEVATAEQHAEPGQVILGRSAWERIAAQCRVEPVGVASIDRDEAGAGQAAEGFYRLAALDPIAPRPQPRPEPSPALETTLRAYIPSAVLNRLEAGQQSWLAELRHVTVLFVSLPEFTADTPLELIQAAMLSIQMTIHRFEGSINKLSVDDKGATLVAALGLPPLAHEDDAARGVQAALAIESSLRALGLQPAIGVASGLAFCGEIGSRQRREYTMIGDVVNLAARLMQAAVSTNRDLANQPAILCDEPTYQRARARVGFQPLPPVSVKGKTEPVAVFRPDERHSLHQAAPEPSDEQLVGRDSERAALAERLRELAANGTGGVMLIEGDAGMGKSRLLDDFGRLAHELRVTSLHGAADPFEPATPYHTWRGVFSQLFDLSILSAPDARRRHIYNLLEDEPEVLELAPLLDAVLPLGMPESATTASLSGQARADATSELLLRLLAESTKRSPKVIILEDAHWADSASWELALLAALNLPRVLLIITLRPLNTEQLPPGYQRLREIAGHLTLNSLAPEEMVSLACQRLGVATLPDIVASLICEKAQGNPFFCEELAYALRDTGQITIGAGECRLVPGADLRGLSFPDTVQSAIMSRIDRLTPTQQLTLKVASVIGRVFPVRTLRAVYPVDISGTLLADDLTNLERLDITLLDTPEPDPAYGFKHAITQDVVYNLMLYAQRRQLHRAVAEWYERTFADDLERLYPLLAYHWSNAGVVVKALDYLSQAGQHALHVSALREARTLFEQALALAEVIDESPANLQRRATLMRSLGDALHLLGDFAAARQKLEQGCALARAVGDQHGTIEALIRLGRLCTDMGAYQSGVDYLNEALAQARASDATRQIAQALSHLGNVAMRVGNHPAAEQSYRESLALFTALDDSTGVAQVHNGLGNAAVDQGHYLEARRHYQESLALSRITGDRWGMAGALSNLGWAAHLLHAYDEAREYYEEALAISRAIGDERGSTIALNNLGFTAIALGDDAAARRYFDEALKIALAIGARPLVLEILVGVARLRLRAGEAERAAELVGFALGHPASNTDVRTQANQCIEQLAALLPDDVLLAAQQRGATLTIEAAIAGLSSTPRGLLEVAP